MSESVPQPAGPSLEDILWRAMDRFAEQPSVLDAEEFAARVAGAFDGELPEESFVDRFIDGNPELAREANMAEAIVRSSSARLHVYHFDLGRLDYVVIEEEEQVLVVSDFGQFALANDRPAQQAIASAVVRDRSGPERRTLDRASSEPRAYLVRQDGDLVVLDVQKLAAAIVRLPVRQVSAPPVERPPLRLLPFEPRPRRLTPRSEARALREHDHRAAMPIAPLARTAGLDDRPIADARPSTAAPTVFVLLPDGSLAQPEMGSAARWHRMVSDWVLRAGLVASSGTSIGVSGSQRFTVESGKVSAVFTGGKPRLAPGGIGATAAARSEGVVAARADLAPVRVLADDELAQAVAVGAARIVAGWRASVPTVGQTRDRYWMQPETVFAPSIGDRELVARADPAAGLDAPAEPQLVATGEPLQLGQITGDPWADWALQVAEGGQAAPLAASALRRRAPGEIRVREEPVVAFRAPDGSFVLNGERGPIRLAANHRPRKGGTPDGAALGDAAPSGAIRPPRHRRTPVAARAGALPPTALSALRLSLERTAAAGGYRLPVVDLAAAPDAVEAGRSLDLAPDDGRRHAAALAAPPRLGDAPGGKIARLVLSLPFPNSGEVHVGPDLAGALDTYLAAPVVPAGGAAPAVSFASQDAARHAAVRRPPPHVPQVHVPPLHVLPLHIPQVLDPALHGPAPHASELARTRAAQGAPETLPIRLDEALPALPPLLREAVLASGGFRPGPGAPLPSAIRPHRLADSLAAPELLVEPDAEPAPARPLGIGEDEIVIPTPLWAQMGRGQSSSTLHVMASPVARTSYAPPLGTYTVVKPAGFRLLEPDMTPPPGTPGVVELAGPTAMRLRPALQGGVRAESLGGKLVLGHVPLDDGESLVAARGRMRVGEPLDPKTVAGLRRGAVQRTPVAVLAAPRSAETPPTEQGLGQTAALGETSPVTAPRTSAQVAAPRRSAQVAAPRTPAQVAAPRTAVRAPVPAAAAHAAGPGALLHPMESAAPAQALAPASARGSMAGALRSAMRIAGEVEARALPARPRLGPFSPEATAGELRAEESEAAGRGATAPAGEVVVSMPAASAAPAGIEGLPPGAWSGTHPGAPGGYVPWSYSDERRRETTTAAGGIRLGQLPRPGVAALPTGMRFRYVAAPLWWSTALRHDRSDAEARASGSRALHSGHRPANSAAAIWRSIFAAGEPADDLSGGMDRGHDWPARGLSGVERRMDVLVSLGLVGGGKAAAAMPAPASRGPETIYVAMDDQGRAGAATAEQVRRGHALAQSVEMRIVAAIPPSPPPLHTMGSGAAPGQAQVLARHRHAPGGEHKAADDTSSQSKIEGSVDAIAQRIYHRIRQRIASDRERFGG